MAGGDDAADRLGVVAEGWARVDRVTRRCGSAALSKRIFFCFCFLSLSSLVLFSLQFACNGRSCEGRNTKHKLFADRVDLEIDDGR